MFDSRHFLLFFAAALLLAITPGPGIFYVLARSLAGGRPEGMLSSFGTFVGGLFHVLAAALGMSTLGAYVALADTQ
jgi:threonine/homoserine/homoserine lactone efflux protein